MKTENPFGGEIQSYKGATTLQQAASMLIDDTLDFVEHDNDWVHAIPPLSYSYEFATVKISGRRQQGHTELVKSYLSDPNYKACVIVPNSQLKNATYRYNHHYGLCNNFDQAQVVTSTQVEHFALSQRGTTRTPLDLCFIEPVMAFKPQLIDRAYKAMFECTKVFVQLQ